MMTYVPEKKVLFTGDAFGTFGTLMAGAGFVAKPRAVP